MWLKLPYLSNFFMFFSFSELDYVILADLSTPHIVVLGTHLSPEHFVFFVK
jgi:hypothetical protein